MQPSPSYASRGCLPELCVFCKARDLLLHSGPRPFLKPSSAGTRLRLAASHLALLVAPASSRHLNPAFMQSPRRRSCSCPTPRVAKRARTHIRERKLGSRATEHRKKAPQVTASIIYLRQPRNPSFGSKTNAPPNASLTRLSPRGETRFGLAPASLDKSPARSTLVPLCVSLVHNSCSIDNGWNTARI